ncbi:MAG TPA: MarR family transcriptional regulator, partial [Dehalococcoidia bacterium]|nr:MarR family transcriptional regulator [Dehalococcoidia bacterium]
MQSEVPGTSEGQVSSVMSARRYAEKFPWADVEAIDAFLTISRTFNALYLALLRRPMPGGSELSRAQHNFLAALYLADGNSLALSEIAREMNVTPTYVTKLSDSLEAEGLV